MAYETESDLDQWYTCLQVATSLATTDRTVRRWIAEGKLPAFKFSGATRVRGSDLHAFAQRIPTSSDEYAA